MVPSKLGNYPLEEYLGSWSERVRVPGLLSEEYSSYKVQIGINERSSIRKSMEFSNNYDVAPEIKAELETGFEFYKVTLVSNFWHESTLKFDFAKISVECISDSGEAQVYSISPLKVDEKMQVTKTFAVDPHIQLSEIASASGLSYTLQKHYEKLHPQIIGHYSAGKEAWWDYFTTPGIKTIQGAQIVEFIVKQPSNVKSEWRALPDGRLKWTSFKRAAIELFRGAKVPKVKTKFKIFNVPR